MEQYIPKYPSKTANDRKNLEIYGCEIEKQPRLEFFYSKKSIGNEEPPLERKIAGFK